MKDIEIQKNVRLSAHTTLQVGGVADYFVVVKTVEEVRVALRFAAQTATPPLILGGGSNLLVSDAGYRGLVIQNRITSKHYEVLDNKVLLTVGAGEMLDEIVAETTQKGYWGLENLSAIPGTIGATPVQNVGAYGVEVSSLITSVEAINSVTKTEKTFTVKECEFGYRDSYFKTSVGRDWVITQVTFMLSVKPNPQLAYGSLQTIAEQKELTPAVVREAICEIRAGKFPNWHVIGTAGSFFKNPIIPLAEYEELKKQYPDIVAYVSDDKNIKVSLGWILDHVCQLRGYCRDGVCLYEQQALVLVNLDAADAKTIDDFANHVADLVFQKTKIKIEREVRSI